MSTPRGSLRESSRSGSQAGNTNARTSAEDAENNRQIPHTGEPSAITTSTPPSTELPALSGPSGISAPASNEVAPERERSRVEEVSSNSQQTLSHTTRATSVPAQLLNQFDIVLAQQDIDTPARATSVPAQPIIQKGSELDASWLEKHSSLKPIREGLEQGVINKPDIDDATMDLVNWDMMDDEEERNQPGTTLDEQSSCRAETRDAYAAFSNANPIDPRLAAANSTLAPDAAQVSYAMGVRDKLAPNARATYEALEDEARKLPKPPKRWDSTINLQNLEIVASQDKPFVPTPAIERPPGKWWPAIPTDANFDPFSEPIAAGPRGIEPTNLVAERPTLLNADPVYSTNFSRQGAANPRPDWMINPQERADLVRGISNLEREIAARPPATQAIFSDIPDFPASTPGDDFMGVQRDLFHDSDEDELIAMRERIRAEDARHVQPKKKATPAKKQTKKEEAADEASDDSFPAEVFVFDEVKYDTGSKGPFTYLSTVFVPIAKGRKPQDIIDYCMEQLAEKQELMTAPEEQEKKEKKIVGQIALWEAYMKNDDDVEEDAEEAKKGWHSATIAGMQGYHELRKETGKGPGFGRVGDYVDVKVLLWRRFQAQKARKARAAKVPDRGDGEEDVEMGG
ncbi:uncharacterized protein AB675_6653 [Cyphellophora attinorum]|uniref:Uncharacterized protein n=1 Tax=Cyphellophora attinorum TaxID=1664694 RepID=A0A0N1HY84_9EURO|nr:uncharacterized protein AB675_6653 [Phialophora attinorum]KPI43260.1 hypothetical protein AB675_6653 [Phialophora attinorum]